VVNHPLGEAIAAATRSLPRCSSSYAGLAGSYAENAELEVATFGSGRGKAGTLRLRNYARCNRLRNAYRDAAKWQRMINQRSVLDARNFRVEVT